MGSFTSDFNFVDDAFYGDGAADGTTQPLDSLLENLIDSNTRWNVRKQHLAPLNFAGEDRIYACPVWMAIAYTPIFIAPGTTTISVDVAATVTSARREALATGTSTVYVRLRLWGTDREVLTDWTGDGTLQSYNATINVGSLGSGWVGALLEIKSEDDGQLTGKAAFDADAGGSYFLASAGTTDLAEGDALLLPASSEPLIFPIGEVDFRYDQYNLSGTAETGWPTLFGDEREIYDVFTTSAEDVAKQSMSYIQPRTVHWSTEVDDGYETRDYVPKPGNEMHPNQAVLGSHVSKHQRNIAGVYERQEIKAVGPQMEEPTQATWGNMWRRWPVVRGDGGSDQPLTDLSFMMDRDTSVITIKAWMHFHHVLKGYSAPRFAAGGVDASLARAFELSTEMDWDITAKILQASGASWSTATEVASATVTLEGEAHWTSYYTSSVSILRQIWYSYYHQDLSTSEEHYMWYEGGLVSELGDLKTLVPVTIALDVSKADMDDFNRPVRLQMLASPDTTSITYRVSTGDEGTERLSARMITCAVAEAGKI